MASDTDLPVAQAIASRLWGPASWWHPGGLAWQWATEQEPGVRRTWDDTAWAWMYQPDFLMVQVDAATPELAREVIAWFEGTRSGSAPRVEAPDSDTGVIAALQAAGYAAMPREPFGLDMRAPAERAPLRLPRGYEFHTAADVSIDVRVEAHRAAWLPGALPYEPALAPSFAPDATSNFDEAKLRRAQSVPPYAVERDLVITTSEGSPAACCTVWFDDASGSAEIEPLGVVPEHRRRGLAQLLCRAACNAVADAGGVEVVIHPRGDAAYPAPRAAYAAAGFRPVGQTRTYGRPSAQ